MRELLYNPIWKVFGKLNEKYSIQLTKSSRRENGGAYCEDVFGGNWMVSKWKMIQLTCSVKWYGRFWLTTNFFDKFVLSLALPKKKSICVFVHLSICVFEYLSIWVFEYLSIWEFEYLNIWVFEYLSIWVFEYLCIGVIVTLCVWIFVFLNICVFVYLSVGVFVYSGLDRIFRILYLISCFLNKTEASRWTPGLVAMS